MTTLTHAILLLAAVGSLILSVPQGPIGWGACALFIVTLVVMGMRVELLVRRTADLNRLRDAYDQLDQQTKLIIRTDLELHRAHEELDRRLASLMSLHRLAQTLQVSLRPEEVFTKLDVPVVTHLGFSKGLLGQVASFNSLEWRSFIGMNRQTVEALRKHLIQGDFLKQVLSNPNPQILQADADLDPLREELLQLMDVSIAVVAGVIPHTGPAGIIILGQPVGGLVNARADQELVGILANQLATAVENSALYEKAWIAQQELEHKVQQRTSELAQANEGLLKLNKAKNDFVSAVSHELRTPLAAIKGYAALLVGGQFGHLTKPQQERIAKVEKHTDLLTQLINNLLDIARIESGKITMERSMIPIDEFLTSIHDFISPQMEAKHIKYAVERNGVNSLIGDSPHLQRVFVNLLSNAIKYTPEGGSIRVSFERKNGSIVASVTDNGCGITPENQEKLFQEFYRANDAINQQIRGTGLGLVLVKRIVEAHQGRVWVSSAKGKGSVFYVSLPSP